MPDEPAFTCRDLGKRFRIPAPHGPEASRRSWRRPKQIHWAVRHVDLDVRPGEIVGLEGENGAGKSTLLRLAARVMHPTEGSFTTRGRVMGLLEVGAGFHHELTGRENVHLSGTLLGMSRRAVAARVDEIAAFAGVEAYFDTPVKRYSVGMYARLGFAVAAHLASEVLLVDEILAVADAGFRARCLERLRATADAGTAVLFVSHRAGDVRTLCDRVVRFEHGAVVPGEAPSAAASPEADLDGLR